jgi:PglZ domain
VSDQLESLRPYVADLLSRKRNNNEPRVFALRCPDHHASGELIHDGQSVRLLWCPSELAVREALVEEPRPDPLVLLTPVSELASDVLGRLTLHRLAHPRPAEALIHLFGVPDIDPSIPSWMMSALVLAAPPIGYERTGARTLDLDRAWRALLRHAHGIEVELGLPALIEWAGTERAAALTRLDDARRTATVDWLEQEIPGARLLVGAVAAGEGPRALAIGLILRPLIAGADEAARIAARTRLEPLLAGTPFEERGAWAWAATAEAALLRLEAADEATAQRARHDAERLLEQLHAEPLSDASTILRSGLRARLRTLAAALDGDGEVEVAADLVAEHTLAARSGAARIARLATRLQRWLRTDVPAPPRDLAEAARRYVDSSCYADLARTVLRHGTEEPALDDAVRPLIGAASDRRAAEERLFARALAAWSAHARTGPELLGVEDLLGEVAAPLAAQRPVLVIVLDGMSHRVAAEMLDDALADGWTELRRTGQPGRALALAALPSVTTYSRSSLFAGRLVKGLAADEVTGFAEHPALLAVSQHGTPPLLFHKRELRDPQIGLSATVRAAIASERQVVGAVVNAIDDHLARSEQLRNPWSVRNVVTLGWLLDAARESGRIAVLLSDHGHVLEWEGGTQRPHGGQGGERWRVPASPAGEDEVLVEGPRVLAGEGQCIMAVDEGLRYAPKKHGYHGGATAQEMLAPALVLSPTPIEGIEGWVEAPNDPPWWWSGVRAEKEQPAAEPTPTSTLVRRPQPETQLSLGLPDEPRRLDNATAARTGTAWISELLSSDTLAAQRRLATRTPLPDERIAAILGALAVRGGKLLRPALAQACGLAPARLAGTLAALQLLLNLEGYPILSVDEISDTVELNLPLLREQFALTR